jgi:hypothetical protein
VSSLISQAVKQGLLEGRSLRLIQDSLSGRYLAAYRTSKKKRKRGRKLIEQFRAEEGSGAILFSPKKVRAALVTGGYRECRRCVGIVVGRSDTELCTYG